MSSSTVGAELSLSRVVDGDTIELSDGTTVRLIGIDTPESVDPRQPVQCLGKEASNHTAALLPTGTAVRLEYDVERVDRYGRTLAYVYRVEDEVFVNAAIARDGYALQLTIPPNIAKVDEIASAVNEARTAGRGLWGPACAGSGAPDSTVRVDSDACDQAYPDVCIPPGPPVGADLDCGDITHRRFRVNAPDPHSFDADGNGVGCEQT